MNTIPFLWRVMARYTLSLGLLWPVGTFALSHRSDAAGRLTWSVQPGGQASHFSYAVAGNITAVAVITPAQDTDGDGLPGTWEIRYSPNVTGRDAQRPRRPAHDHHRPT